MLNQPKGVFSLASTEMWERLSFYTMQAILVLYVSAAASKGGLGWSEKEALFITNLYGGAVYATPIIGGYLADKYLGSKRSVSLGGILMCLGHFMLAIHSIPTFYLALVLLCIGCGFLKPCITSMVGECYADNDSRRESGFALFYMAINIGGFVGPFVAGSLSNNYGYHVTFATAGFGLLIGLINFFYASRNGLKNIGNTFATKAASLTDKLPQITPVEKTRLKVYMAMCVANIVWNIVYALPYGILTLYAEHNVNRSVFGKEIPSAWYYGMYAIFIVILSPILGSVYNKLSKTKFDFSLSKKLGMGYILVAVGCTVLLPMIHAVSTSSSAKVSPVYLVVFYIIFALSELLTVPVLLSAATCLAPKQYVSRMVSFNMLVSWSLGAWIAGIVSGYSSRFGSMQMFVALIIICSAIGVLHFITDRKVESLCLEPR